MKGQRERSRHTNKKDWKSSIIPKKPWRGACGPENRGDPQSPYTIDTIPTWPPGPEAAAIPVELKMSGVSLPRVSGCPSLQKWPWPGSDAETPHQDKGVDILSLGEGNLAKQWIQIAQAWFSWETPLGSFLAKAKWTKQTKWKGVWKQWKEECKAKQGKSARQEMSGQISHSHGGKWVSGAKVSSQPKWFWPSTMALQEIHWYQKTTKLLIWKFLFQRLIWEFAQGIQFEIRFQGSPWGPCRKPQKHIS